MSEIVSDMLSAATVIQRNRDMLLKILTDLAISEVTIHYEIYADAGDIAQLVVFPESLQSCLDSTLLPYQTLVIARNAEQGHYQHTVSVQRTHPFFAIDRKGNNSSRRLFGHVGNFSKVSVNHANGSKPFNLAVANKL